MEAWFLDFRMGLKFKQNTKNLWYWVCVKGGKYSIWIMWERLEESHWVSPSWWSRARLPPSVMRKLGCVDVEPGKWKSCKHLCGRRLGLLNSAHETLLYDDTFSHPNANSISVEKRIIYLHLLIHIYFSHLWSPVLQIPSFQHKKICRP